MPLNYKEMSNIELAAYLCQALFDIGIKTTLSGGFCVEIYSFGEYTSMDIDLIDQSIYKHKEYTATKNLDKNYRGYLLKC